jgi:hypothetical protein
VMVAGKIVVRNRKVLGVDVDGLLREARGMLAAIRGRNGELQSAVRVLL